MKMIMNGEFERNGAIVVYSHFTLKKGRTPWKPCILESGTLDEIRTCSSQILRFIYRGSAA
jgi:hypothetical protein